MPVHDILSPELLEEIFIHTLDYSHKLNNRQLKRLQLVSKLFDQVATRILYRWIVCETSWSVNRLFQVIMRNKKRLGPLVRSITFLNCDGLSPGDEVRLLQATPLCSNLQNDHSSQHSRTLKIGRQGSYSPAFPKSERFAMIDFPEVARPQRSPTPEDDSSDYSLPLAREDLGEPTLDENGVEVPRTKPKAALEHLSTLPSPVKHLSINAKNVEDFTGDEVVKLPLDQLSTIELRCCKKISQKWTEAFIKRSLENDTLKVLHLYGLENKNILGMLGLILLAGRFIPEELKSKVKGKGQGLKTELSLRELTMIGETFDSMPKMEANIFAGMVNLQTLTISRRGSPIDWSGLPPNLRNLEIQGYKPSAIDLENLTEHISSGAQPRLESLSFHNSSSWFSGYLPSFPRTTSSASPPTAVGLTRLRFEDTAVKDSKALHKLLEICSPTLRYLALHDLDNLTPWDSISQCTSLRWLELGTIRELMGDYGEEESENEEAPPRTERRLPYETRRTTASKFLSTTFPYLDYVYLHLGDSFSLFDVAEVISNDQWPALKVLDLGWISRGLIYESEEQKEENGTGFDRLFTLSKMRGFTIATEGSALNGIGDLWCRMLNDKGWNDDSD